MSERDDEGAGAGDPEGQSHRRHVSGQGTEQAGRSPRALEAGYVDIDERGIGDLLRIAARLASNLHYVDSENKRRGSWTDLYQGDSSYVLAEIASLDPRALEAAFLRLDARGDHVRQALQIRALATAFDRWLKVLARDDDEAARSIAWMITDLVKRDLAPSLHAVAELLQGTGKPEYAPETAYYRQFHHSWGLGPNPDGDARFLRSRLPAEPREHGQHLVSSFYVLLNAVSYLRESSRAGLTANLGSQSHDPAMGLVLTFLHLFRKAQDRLNTFPARRLDFYYFDLLGLAPRPREPDSARLILTPTPDASAVFIPRGTEFSAGRGRDDLDITFASDHDVVVSDARVASLRSLFYERNELISPEREFGFVTRVLGSSVLEGVKAGAENDEPPLVGRDGPADVRFVGKPVSIGFAVASPIFALSEGRRRLTFDIHVGAPSGYSDAEVQAAVNELEGIPKGSAHEFFRRFGDIFSRRLLAAQGRGRGASGGWLSEAQKRAVREAARMVLDEGGEDAQISLAVIERVLDRDPVILFHDLFRRALTARFTGENGWVDVDDFYVGPVADATTPRFRIEVSLGPDVGPVVPYQTGVHGALYETSLPVMAFRINPQAIFFPYSFLDRLPVRSIDVEVQVSGTTDVVAYNQLGRLDATKPFLPFGPLPTHDSYLVVGSYEAAKKNLTAASLDIEWGDLPRAPGGFAQHYARYDNDVANDSFKVELALLRDSQWQPMRSDQRPTAALFRSEDEGGRIDRHARINLRVVDAFKPISGALTRDDYQSTMRARQGLFRLSLAASKVTFGHGDYPTLLTEVLSANARRKKPEPVPNAPYTPLIARISMNYEARTSIRPRSGGVVGGHAYSERILHEHPFGVVDLTSDEAGFTLLPARPGRARAKSLSREREGYLFIGLTATDLAGSLSLLFEMRRDSTRQTSVRDAEVAWFYLASNQWRDLDSSRVLADTTNDFEVSGIVTLDVPEDIDRKNTVMPGGLYWLAVGANSNLLSFTARLLTVQAGAVQVSWVDRSNDREDLAAGLRARTIKAPVVQIPGLASVEQVGRGFGGSAPEDRDALVLRASERLRHKNRAMVPWDFERLVLDRFPDVFKVKVFPNTDTRLTRPAPGRVLVVVVPRLLQQRDDRTLTPGLSGSDLLRIRDALRSVASDSARVHVRNAAYEQVHIRCTVKLAGGGRSGYFIRALNDAIVDFISPWRAGGYGPSFGWSIRRKDVEARILALPFVKFVTDFSMLHITTDATGRHSLADTARAPERDELVARYPWSLPVPALRHFIQTTAQAEEIPAEVTGVGELEIGSNFILDSRNRHE